VLPKVDQRAGLLSLPHLGNFRRTAPHLPLLRKHSPEGETSTVWSGYVNEHNALQTVAVTFLFHGVTKKHQS